MEDRTLAVIGGQLGRAMAEEGARRPGWRVRLLTHQEIELADRASIVQALAPSAHDPTPTVFVNTAYWANEEPEPAFRVNATGARLLAEACAERGVRLVQISTDYVFDGEAASPYQEEDRAEPRSVYGITKLAGELLVRQALPEALIVRVSSLYGEGGSRAKGGTSFVSDMLKMADEGKTIKVVTDQFHSPTYAPDAATTIFDLLEHDVQGVVHVSNTGSCSKYAFAETIFALAGLRPELLPIRLADLPPRPPRPRSTVLAHRRLVALGIPLPRPWQDGLRDYLARTDRLAASAATTAVVGGASGPERIADVSLAR